LGATADEAADEGAAAADCWVSLTSRDVAAASGRRLALPWDENATVLCSAFFPLAAAAGGGMLAGRGGAAGDVIGATGFGTVVDSSVVAVATAGAVAAGPGFESGASSGARFTK
jgi:hypothetical protein